MRNLWRQQHVRNYHNGFASITTMEMLLTPVMMHPCMNIMLLMLVMSMLIIMFFDYNTDDAHDNNNDTYGQIAI